MAASINPVAKACEPPPAAIQAIVFQLISGGVSPSAKVWTANSAPMNGRLNRKRTWVAPAGPSALTRSRWVALRAVCAAEAAMVQKIQAEAEKAASMGRSGSRRFGSCQISSARRRNPPV